MEGYTKTIQKIRKYILSTKSRRYIVVFAGVIMLAFLFSCLLKSNLFGSVGIQLSNETKKTEHDPLSGVWVEHVTDLKQVFGVMIDEHAEARPQSGIDKAFLVIEAPVEAGIPRLLAFFSSEIDVKKIGPVRSARPYFIDWVHEFGALYSHVGGSNDALEKIKTEKTFDINEFWNGDFYWRSQDRFAPHNTYTSSELLGNYMEKKNNAGRTGKSSYGVWQFQDSVAQKGSSQSFQISYLNPGYVFKWNFDETNNRYIRHNGNILAKTQDGNWLVANNIAVVITDVEVIDSVGRRKIRTTGEGESIVFQNGNRIESIWKKPSVSDRLRFYGKDGSELFMNPGTTWIEIISNKSQLIEKENRE